MVALNYLPIYCNSLSQTCRESRRRSVGWGADSWASYRRASKQDGAYWPYLCSYASTRSHSRAKRRSSP